MVPPSLESHSRTPSNRTKLLSSTHPTHPLILYLLPRQSILGTSTTKKPPRSSNNLPLTTVLYSNTAVVPDTRSNLLAASPSFLILAWGIHQNTTLLPLREQPQNPPHRQSSSHHPPTHIRFSRIDNYHTPAPPNRIHTHTCPCRIQCRSDIPSPSAQHASISTEFYYRSPRQITTERPCARVNWRHWHCKPPSICCHLICCVLEIVRRLLPFGQDGSDSSSTEDSLRSVYPSNPIDLPYRSSSSPPPPGPANSAVPPSQDKCNYAPYLFLNFPSLLLSDSPARLPMNYQDGRRNANGSLCSGRKCSVGLPLMEASSNKRL